MHTTELQVVGPVGLAVAWGTLAAALGALIVGLVVGTAYRLRAARRQRAAIADGERERASLRRVASELARTSDVEGVARALLSHLTDVARNERCGRMLWMVQGANERAIRFYESVGAVAVRSRHRPPDADATRSKPGVR